MATRSTISLEFADGTIGQVYCHWDGYLAHNGKMLMEYYSNPFILRDLIDLGSLSSLRPQIGTKHPFSMFEANMTQDEYANLYRDMCTFYERDRGERSADATYFKDYLHFLVDGQGRLSRAKGAVAPIYLGAQILQTDGLAAIDQQVFSLNVLWDQMIKQSRIYGVFHQGGWCDVGHPEAIALAESLLHG